MCMFPNELSETAIDKTFKDIVKRYLRIANNQSWKAFVDKVQKKKKSAHRVEIQKEMQERTEKEIAHSCHNEIKGCCSWTQLNRHTGRQITK